ncbi:GNAT family N-acetyltransferase [Vagococcus silagei]|uniref:N-acetyltransferase n=1 Tax=Vagococcus silagei TaxID=2508885 RepID=A0A4S3B4Q6_9ENTE|nr:GNAT family protein [Vagococcus silagei]THB62114.1 N-acetyltransferase [Vagococcus silagei]
MTQYFSFKISPDIELVFPTIETAKPMFEIIDRDREHLGKYLDFVDYTKTVEDEENFIKLKLKGMAEGTDALYFIRYKDEFIGCIELHFIDQKAKKAEIGYWLCSDFVGRGIMTQSVTAFCDIAYARMGLNKITLLADVENKPSNQVAIKSGFTFVGMDPEDLHIRGELRDLNRYVKLKEK